MSTTAQPLYSRLKDIAHLSINDSTTSLCSEAEREEHAMSYVGFPPFRQSSTLSSTSASNAIANAKKKKKAAIWAEKYETTAVVFGPLESHDLFKELVQSIKENVGEIKSDYYRQEQFCGFVYFFNEDSADDCKHRFNGVTFQGKTVHACSPSQFFKNEDEAFPDPGRQQRIMTTQISNLSSTSTSSCQEPTTTLVIKNLCFGLKQEKLLAFMAGLQVPPQSVSYHYDNNGLFRGVAFAKYHSSEAAADSLKELQGMEIGGRKLRVEFKRRTSTLPSVPVREQSFDASVLAPLRAQNSSLSSNSNSNSTPLSAHTLTNLSRFAPPRQTSFNLPAGIRMSDREPSPHLRAPSLGASTNSSPVPAVNSFLQKKSQVLIREGMEFLEIEATRPDMANQPPPPSTSLKLNTPMSRPILRAAMEFTS